MHYWDFFPTGDAGTGCIPVWGFATVSESRVDGVDVGERFYGYWPMADEVVLRRCASSPSGFFDGAAHRRELPAVYNRYLRCSSDPIYRARARGAAGAAAAALHHLVPDRRLPRRQRLLRRAHGAGLERVEQDRVRPRASAWQRRRGEPGAPKVVGLTSPANLAFTRELGCYDDVVAYDDVDGCSPATTRAVYVDMSGERRCARPSTAHWRDQLAYSCSVGGTHWQALGGGKGLPGPRPVLFFAPAQIKKRVAEWGATRLRGSASRRAWQRLHRSASPMRTTPWLRVVAGDGRDAVQSTYAALLDGRVPADEGRVLAL